MADNIGGGSAFGFLRNRVSCSLKKAEKYLASKDQKGHRIYRTLKIVGKRQDEALY